MGGVKEEVVDRLRALGVDVLTTTELVPPAENVKALSLARLGHLRAHREEAPGWVHPVPRCASPLAERHRTGGDVGLSTAAEGLTAGASGASRIGNGLTHSRIVGEKSPLHSSSWKLSLSDFLHSLEDLTAHRTLLSLEVHAHDLIGCDCLARTSRRVSRHARTASRLTSRATHPPLNLPAFATFRLWISLLL